MILLKPNNISGEIMTLLDEADEKVIIVSPYCKIDKWYKLLKKFTALQERKIGIEFYVRDDERDSIEQVKKIGIDPICIPNLHAKLYMNEHTAIVTSMNLLLSSEISSLDIGYKTTTKEEYNELLEFYNRNIKRTSAVIKKSIKEFDWRSHIYESLNEHCGKTDIYEDQGTIQIKTIRNNYNCFIWQNKKNNWLRMFGILSGAEFEFAKRNAVKIENNCGLAIELQAGTKGRYDTIWGTLNKQPLVSSIINEIDQKDAEMIAKNIIKFIIQVENVKKLKV
jgi:hypothetical protein